MRNSILLAVFAATLAGTAMADHGHGHGKMPRGDVSKADFLQRMEQRFDAMDSNQDGVLSEAERKAAHEKMRSMREEKRKARMASKASAVSK